MAKFIARKLGVPEELLGLMMKCKRATITTNGANMQQQVLIQRRHLEVDFIYR